VFKKIDKSLKKKEKYKFIAAKWQKFNKQLRKEAAVSKNKGNLI
jgi:hypothetical protein